MRHRAPRGHRPRRVTGLHSDREYETSPFKLLLAVLGSDSSEPPHLPMSDNVWHMRAECAARGGDYVKVALRMAALAKAMRCPSSRSTTSSTCAGESRGSRSPCAAQEFRWPAKIEERWIDPMILCRFATLLEAQEHRPPLYLPRSGWTGLPAGLRNRRTVCRPPQAHRPGIRVAGLTAGTQTAMGV